MNIQNAREILEDVRFAETEEVKLVKAQRETTIFINRHKAHGTVQYQVINDVSRLSNDEMERIVAVFVHGPAWQFKGWNYFGLNDKGEMVNKWNAKPVNIFSDVQAFHIYYDDIKIEPNVLKWNVERIPVSRMKRYKDKANLARIWEKIDKHIQKNRPWLRY
ncbi:hypothetical protein WR25_14616 [Diploscapter pachys]|uniref:Cell division control protein 73 C-terminal domain-containing protein n=1 Tax=Diploscapter pachys TaxID=2018661 RepID=A0A2A2M2B6_9BILA|nr:hypothetical protein WR25_14616 [Diploscapter pachys]